MHELDHLVRAVLASDAKTSLTIIRHMREAVELAEERGVRAARRLNVSWDTIGNLLGKHASHLIEKYPEH